MSKKIKKITSLVLAIALVFTTVGFSSFAEPAAASCGGCSTSCKKEISKATLEKTTYYYNGYAKKPCVTVCAGDKVILDGKKTGNSKVSLCYAKGRTKPGSYKVTVEGKGNYDGKICKSFRIKIKNTCMEKPVAGKQKFTVKWSKCDAKYISGYQIRYSRNCDMSNAKKTSRICRTTTSKTIKGLSEGKKYYVQIRTYKKIDGEYYYSDWSSKKTVCTKSCDDHGCGHGGC